MSSNTNDLKPSQLQQYWDNGHLNGIDIMKPEQAAIVRKKLIQLVETEKEVSPERWAKKTYQPWNERGSPWWHWFQGMARHPTILAKVASIIGPDIFIRNADIFVKDGHPKEGIGWHVDSTSPKSEADKMLSVWFAITDSNHENGAMEWVSASHKLALPLGVNDKYSLTLPEQARAEVDTLPRFTNILRPGQMSIHHFRTFHKSGVNETQTPRIGLVMRYFAASASRDAVESGQAVLVAGENNPGTFSLKKTFPVTLDRDSRFT